MKKILNLFLALSLTIVVGLSFFSTGTEASARMMNIPDITCKDYPPETLPGTERFRKCGPPGDCPWKLITLNKWVTDGTCTL